jgi:hypothetical protein
MPYPAIDRPVNRVAGKYHKTPKNLPSLGGRGERGGGIKASFFTPTLTLPRRRGRGITGEIKTIFG